MARSNAIIQFNTALASRVPLISLDKSHLIDFYYRIRTDH